MEAYLRVGGEMAGGKGSSGYRMKVEDETILVKRLK
jgi:hypothetical protein